MSLIYNVESFFEADRFLLIFSAIQVLFMYNDFDTIASVATAVSHGGISVIRISGSEAFSIINRIFRPVDPDVDMKNPESYRMYYGNIVDGTEVIDECIVLIMKGPRSYTREDVVEIDCHAGLTVVSDILQLVLRNGARAAEPGEFTKRAFLNGRIDLSQAEAVMDLISSRNESSRKNAIHQLKGALSDKIKKIRSEIIYEIAFMESAMDDPEHYDLDGYPASLRKKNEDWILEIGKMADSFDDGRRMSEGIRTCIVGKPNAGKSSLLNALMGEDRAIVTEVPGTTRDTLEEQINIGGITLSIVDTAGIRNTSDLVESIGVDRARKEIEKAELVLFVIDSSEEITEEDLQIAELVKDKNKIILVNKADLRRDEEIFHDDALRRFMKEKDEIVSISAKYREGMDNFNTVLKNMFFHGKIDVNHDVIITNERHKKQLSQAYESLICTRNSIDLGLPEDFFTIDLMNAYESLGLIVGEAVEEDLVNEIFSKFCTGK